MLACLLVLSLPFPISAVQAQQPGLFDGENTLIYIPQVMVASPCVIGATISDPSDDVNSDYIDVLSLSTSQNDQTLTAVFTMRDVPATLTFNRVGVPQNVAEYAWIITIDVDNNRQTGNGSGMDYELSAMHFVSHADTPVIRAIPDGVQVNTWKYDPPTQSWNYVSQATLTVDTQSNTMQLVGAIPGISSNSRFDFLTEDYGPYNTVENDFSSICGVH